mmetsp:Transcript_18231/g.57405  ORF Transcript_18231/g.57405 Transcript_18231/m.57405 type:complete len:209 (-) Transcript_18231:979-1605(-)
MARAWPRRAAAGTHAAYGRRVSARVHARRPRALLHIERQRTRRGGFIRSWAVLVRHRRASAARGSSPCVKWRVGRATPLVLVHGALVGAHGELVVVGEGGVGGGDVQVACHERLHVVGKERRIRLLSGRGRIHWDELDLDAAHKLAARAVDEGGKLVPPPRGARQAGVEVAEGEVEDHGLHGRAGREGALVEAEEAELVVARALREYH